MDQAQFVAWLRREMRRRSMSQRQLGHFAGVNHGTISRLLKGEREPNYSTVARLVAVFKSCPLHDEEAAKPPYGKAW